MTLALDASTPAQVTKTASGSTLTTASFTAPSPSLVVAYYEQDESGTVSTSIADTGGLTWTPLDRLCAVVVGEANSPTPGGTAQDGYIRAWSASPGSATARTVTVTQAGSGGTPKNAALAVKVYTDSGGAPTIGAVVTAGGTGLPTVNLTTTAPNSWVWAHSNDWAQKGLGTAGSGQTLTDEYNPATFITTHVWKQNSTTPSSGTVVTMNLTAPGTQTWNIGAIEIKANPGASTAVFPPDRKSRRPRFQPYRRRATVNYITTPDLSKPLPPQAQERRRAWFPVRHRSGTVNFIPAQVVATVTVVPPQPGRRRAVLLPRRRSEVSEPPWTVTVQAPAQQSRRRVVVPPRKRAGSASPPWTVTVTVPAQPARKRVPFIPRQRGRGAQPVPPQVVVNTTQALPPQQQRRRLNLLPRRHSEVAEPPWVGAVVITVQALPAQAGRKRLGFLPRRRSGTANFVPAQVITVQALPPQGQRRRSVFVPQHRNGTSQVVPVTVQTQPLPPQPSRRRTGLLTGRRGRQAVPVPVTVTVTVPQVPSTTTRRRFPPVPPRKGRATQVPPPLVVVVPHPIPAEPRRRRLVFLPRRWRYATQPVPNQQVVVTPTPGTRIVVKSPDNRVVVRVETRVTSRDAATRVILPTDTDRTTTRGPGSRVIYPTD